jgi:hypothetical protein
LGDTDWPSNGHRKKLFLEEILIIYILLLSEAAIIDGILVPAARQGVRLPANSSM